MYETNCAKRKIFLPRNTLSQYIIPLKDMFYFLLNITPEIEKPILLDQNFKDERLTRLATKITFIYMSIFLLGIKVA